MKVHELISRLQVLSDRGHSEDEVQVCGVDTTCNYVDLPVVSEAVGIAELRVVELHVL